MKSVSRHYSGGGSLARRIADDLRKAGTDPADLVAADFESVDEFHFRGREATLELIEQLNLMPDSKVLDIGSGLGGVARTIAENTGSHVTGIELTGELCDVAAAISGWVGLGEKTDFRQGDATDLPFSNQQFDSAVTVHVAMNIPDKGKLCTEARRVLKPGARFAVYDILQGEGGDVLYPAPWAADPSISHLATPGEMASHLTAAGFKILRQTDSTTASCNWLEERTTAPKTKSVLPATTRLLFGNASREMTRNQLVGLRERRMLTYCFICEA